MSEILLKIAGTGAIAIVCLMLCLWALSVKNRNAGYVDLGWVLGLLIMAGTCGLYGPGYPIRKLLILAMVSLWGLRLAGLLIHRFIRDPKEDARYQEIRRRWGRKSGLNFFLLFQLQGVLAVVLAAPFIVSSLNPHGRISGVEWLGALIWMMGIGAETLADEQLRRFKSNPLNRGKTCQTGLWYYSRHPNYFFEWLTWVGYFVFALGSPWGGIAVLSPLLMLHFLLNVSGVPLAEQQSLRSRGEEYREYQRTTSKFVPWPKRN